MRRSGLSSREQQDIWRRYGIGESQRSISRTVGRDMGTLRRLIASTGGRQPADLRRSPLRLSLSEREEISRGLVAGESCRSIARQLGRAPSTVSREIARNGGRGRYRACEAERIAFTRARRPKATKLGSFPQLRHAVEALLKLRWSPQQIAGWLARTCSGDREFRVSHETIYLALFVQPRATLRKQLTRYLRSRRKVRSPRTPHVVNGQGQLRNAVHISERPTEALDRAVPGHWGGDLMLGKGNSAIATLVERSSRFTVLVRLQNGRTSEAVLEALKGRIATLPQPLVRSLTWDRGVEMARHAEFTRETGLQLYFCDPRSPWQRGSNENTNGLLRQYYPKGTSLAAVTQQQLDAVAEELNDRPRQTLGFRSPSEVFDEAVALTT